MEEVMCANVSELCVTVVMMVYSWIYIPNRLARAVELFEYSLHVVVELTVFTFLHESGSRREM